MFSTVPGGGGSARQNKQMMWQWGMANSVALAKSKSIPFEVGNVFFVFFEFFSNWTDSNLPSTAGQQHCCNHVLWEASDNVSNCQRHQQSHAVLLTISISRYGENVYQMILTDPFRVQFSSCKRCKVSVWMPAFSHQTHRRTKDAFTLGVHAARLCVWCEKAKYSEQVYAFTRRMRDRREKRFLCSHCWKKIFCCHFLFLGHLKTILQIDNFQKLPTNIDWWGKSQTYTKLDRNTRTSCCCKLTRAFLHTGADGVWCWGATFHKRYIKSLSCWVQVSGDSIIWWGQVLLAYPIMVLQYLSTGFLPTISVAGLCQLHAFQHGFSRCGHFSQVLPSAVQFGRHNLPVSGKSLHYTTRICRAKTGCHAFRRNWFL